MQSLDEKVFGLLVPLLYSFHCFPIHDFWNLGFANEDVMVFDLTKDNGNRATLENTDFVSRDEIARTQSICHVVFFISRVSTIYMKA